MKLSEVIGGASADVVEIRNLWNLSKFEGRIYQKNAHIFEIHLIN